MLREAVRTRSVWAPGELAGWAREDPLAVVLRLGDRRVTARTLDLRSRRLAGGLLAMGADQVDIVCCAGHLDDLLVAHLASRLAGASLHRHDVSAPGRGAGGCVLACAEGTEVWRGRGHVIGDGPYVRWWPVFERSHEPLLLAPGIALDELEVLEPAPELVHGGDPALALAAMVARIPQRVAPDLSPGR